MLPIDNTPVQIVVVHESMARSLNLMAASAGGEYVLLPGGDLDDLPTYGWFPDAVVADMRKA